MTELFALVRRKVQLKQQQEELLSEQRQLEKEVLDLKIAAHNIQVDAEALEGFSIKGTLLKITGKYKERLEAQRRKAHHAKANYDFAVARLEHIKAQLNNISTQLQSCCNCEYALSSALTDRLGFTPCSEAYAFVLGSTQLLHSGDLLAETGQKLHDAITDVQAFLQARYPVRSSYGVPSAIALQTAIDHAQVLYRDYLESADMFCQKLAGQEFSFDAQALLVFGPDYLESLHMDTLVDSRGIHVQNAVTSLNLQWKSLRPQLEKRLSLARTDWMNALCQYEKN